MTVTMHGVLIAESLRVGAELSELPLTVLSLRRVAVSTRAPGQPSAWTLLSFETDVEPERLADRLSEVLDAPGYYVDFHTDTEVFVVFAGRVFRYATGDEAGRAAAADYARSMGVPESQLDWGDTD